MKDDCSPGDIDAFLEQLTVPLLAVQFHPDPEEETKERPSGNRSVTVIVPLVAT